MRHISPPDPLSATLAVDAHSSNGDFRLLGNRPVRHNSHTERIDIERFLQVQRVNDFRDFQYKVQPLAGVFALL